MVKGAYYTWDINTNPGENGPFAPPPGWRGDGQDYIQLMYQRWQDKTLAPDIEACAVCHRVKEPVFSGPFSPEAARILGRIKERLAAKKASANAV
jgi:hypothetical protein